MLTTEEIQRVNKDYTWLDRCTCGVLPVDAFFVSAGQTIADETLEVARKCPVRREEIIHAYSRNLSAGYFGGLSPGQRRSMTLEEALDMVESEERAAQGKPQLKVDEETLTDGIDIDVEYT